MISKAFNFSVWIAIGLMVFTLHSKGPGVAGFFALAWVVVWMTLKASGFGDEMPEDDQERKSAGNLFIFGFAIACAGFIGGMLLIMSGNMTPELTKYLTIDIVLLIMGIVYLDLQDDKEEG